MDLAMTGMIDEVPIASQANPKRGTESARDGSDDEDKQIDPGGEIVFHGRLGG